MMNTTESSSSTLAAASEKHDDEDDKTADEMGSTSNNGDDACILTLKEEEQKVVLSQNKQKVTQQRKLFMHMVAVRLVVFMLVGGALAALLILVHPSSSSWSSSSSSSGDGCAKKQKNPPQQQQQPQGSSSSSSSSTSSSWISWTLPADLSLQSPYGALAMNRDGSILAIGDPKRDAWTGDNMNIYGDAPPPTLYPGRVIMLEAVVVHDDEVEYKGDASRLSYRILQVLPGPDDDDNGFGTALALSSSTTNNITLVVGIPRDSGLLSNNTPQVGGTVQVYVQKTTTAAAAAANVNNQTQENDLNNWELDDKFAASQQSSHAETGSWVVVSDDGSLVSYSAPDYGSTAGYRPTMGAVMLSHSVGEQGAVWLGECKDYDAEVFGQTVSMSSGVLDDTYPVVVITHGGCWTNETYRTITVWGSDDSWTNLVVGDPNEDCVVGGTGTAATVSKDGKRIVVLAACLDQQTYQTSQAIYTFEKDGQDWVERVSTNNEVVYIDNDLVQYRMSSFAFDDDAKTVVLTAATGGSDLVCYKWNETTVSWQESWRKAANENDNDSGSFVAVALSGNGKRLAIIRTHENSPQLAVYNLPT